MRASHNVAVGQHCSVRNRTFPVAMQNGPECGNPPRKARKRLDFRAGAPLRRGFFPICLNPALVGVTVQLRTAVFGTSPLPLVAHQGSAAMKLLSRNCAFCVLLL